MDGIYACQDIWFYRRRYWYVSGIINVLKCYNETKISKTLKVKLYQTPAFIEWLKAAGAYLPVKSVVLNLYCCY